MRKNYRLTDLIRPNKMIVFNNSHLLDKNNFLLSILRLRGVCITAHPVGFYAITRSFVDTRRGLLTAVITWSLHNQIVRR